MPKIVLREITFRNDQFVGEENHPVCVFFEAFPSSANPEETYFGEWFCHMTQTSGPTNSCKGDYLKCPIAYGNLTKQSNVSKVHTPKNHHSFACPECGRLGRVKCDNLVIE